MNIFFLDPVPGVCASYHCDQHVVKMVLETAQLLSTCHHVAGTAKPAMYKQTHTNHPCAVWVRQSRANYLWAYELLSKLCEEFETRRGKEHKTAGLLPVLSKPPNLPDGKVTEPPMCLPDQYKSGSVCDSYRRYYNGEKSKFANYKWGRAAPSWFKDAS